MSKVFIEETSLTAIGDAIRAKTGGTEALSVPTGMVDAIASIETGGGSSTEIEDAILNHTLSGAYANNRITKLYDCAFNSSHSLTSVDFPNVTFVGENAFNDCVALESANLPLASTIGGYAFAFSGLKKAYFPAWDQVTGGTFAACSQLESVYLPKSSWVYPSAFANCTALTRVDLPAATYFNYDTFLNCSALTTLILRNTSQVAELSTTGAFSGSSIEAGTGYVYVPQDLLASYKTATNWSTFAAQFRAIEDYPEICEEVIPE